MDRRHLSFIALAITMLYGASFAVFDETPKGYAAIGGVVVALCWIAVGVFGKDTARDATAGGCAATGLAVPSAAGRLPGSCSAGSTRTARPAPARPLCSASATPVAELADWVRAWSRADPELGDDRAVCHSSGRPGVAVVGRARRVDARPQVPLSSRCASHRQRRSGRAAAWATASRRERRVVGAHGGPLVRARDGAAGPASRPPQGQPARIAERASRAARVAAGWERIGPLSVWLK